MSPTALVTIHLEGWPPPVIEIHALVAALPQHDPRSNETPAKAIQHLNELVLTFSTSEPWSASAIDHARETARNALAAVWDGSFDIARARIT